MRGVTGKTSLMTIKAYISTHTPHARRDYRSVGSLAVDHQFQLTRLMRGVTIKRLNNTL